MLNSTQFTMVTVPLIVQATQEGWLQVAGVIGVVLVGLIFALDKLGLLKKVNGAAAASAVSEQVNRIEQTARLTKAMHHELCDDDGKLAILTDQHSRAMPPNLSLAFQELGHSEQDWSTVSVNLYLRRMLGELQADRVARDELIGAILDQLRAMEGVDKHVIELTAVVASLEDKIA